jgi:hypothetical protein
MRRGQAALELALSSLILVTLITAAVYFGEVTFGSLKVTEAAQSGLWDMTHYKHHAMLRLSYQNSSQVSRAASKAQADTQLAYADFDGRSSMSGRTTLTHVMTNATNMSVSCRPGGAPGYDPNPLSLLVYTDNTGASCDASADFLTGPMMPKHFVDDSGGFFKETNFARPVLTACATGRASGGRCAGRFAVMLDDWGLTGPAGGEWRPCAGLPLEFGIPCPTNLSYWWTAFKTYLTSYTINMLLKPEMMQMPASLAAQWVAFANPMGGVAGIPAFPLTGNESTFYMSFTGSVTLFQQPVWTKSGEGFKFWETTPFGVSLAVPYATAFKQRFQNGGCYLGKRCR